MYPRLYEKSNRSDILAAVMNIVFIDSEREFFSNDERYLHIMRVLKKKVDDTFTAGIKNGPEGIARITRIDEKGLTFTFEALRPMRPLLPICMIVGFPRPIQLRRLLRDLASVGARKIMLAGTDLGEKSYRESRLADPEVARKNILDGCIQAGATAIPELSIDSSVEQVLTRVRKSSVKILLDVVPLAAPISSLDFSNVNEDNPLVLAIGSERGWTERERALFKDDGFIVCSLGDRILRTETAATAALAVAAACTKKWKKENESRSN